MSLFENDEYRWRETFFVLFKEEKRPTVEAVLESLGTLGGGYAVSYTHLTLPTNREV